MMFEIGLGTISLLVLIGLIISFVVIRFGRNVDLLQHDYGIDFEDGPSVIELIKSFIRRDSKSG